MPMVKRLLGKKKTHRDGLTFEWTRGNIQVSFTNGRHQAVRYCEQGDTLVFTSKIAPAKTVRKLGEEIVTEELLLRNRVTEVVTFGFGPRNCVEASIVQKLSTLQQEELYFYVGLLAREADRLEYVLTGGDRF